MLKKGLRGGLFYVHHQWQGKKDNPLCLVKHSQMANSLDTTNPPRQLRCQDTYFASEANSLRKRKLCVCLTFPKGPTGKTRRLSGRSVVCGLHHSLQSLATMEQKSSRLGNHPSSKHTETKASKDVKENKMPSKRKHLSCQAVFDPSFSMTSSE
ncbi:hypothetical protein LZ32DRAFT_101057 [Colletotrichum eremochloae]|nr:hypothetical protein LZ32DRAFT_101057 [Colletotrichum eremochloae]